MNTVRVIIPDGIDIDVVYEKASNTAAAAAPPPPVAADSGLEELPKQTVPQCADHGAMTYHPPGTKRDGSPLSASYRCDKKTDGAFCKTKTVWL